MPIKRELALKIIRYLVNNPSFYFPFKIMCQGYASHTDDDNDFVEIVPIDDYENLVEDLNYDTFELWEDLQNLDLQTLELISKGFIDKILKNEKNLLKETTFDEIIGIELRSKQFHYFNIHSEAFKNAKTK